MTKLNVLILGGGGREHALAWKIAQSPRLEKLFVAPGNAGTAAVATNVDIAPTNTGALIEFARSNHIDFTVVGPDDILAIGTVNAFEAAGLKIFGPTKAAARIESSKAFSKGLMAQAEVPTARFKTFTKLADAEADVHEREYPLVVKASGLALGKGVYICHDIESARQALTDIMERKIFGEAGSEVVIEDYLGGQEVSIHAFCDGHTAAIFPAAQDHKRISDGDSGPNTGGMGAFAPVPWVEPLLLTRIRETIVEPILTQLEKSGAPFKGLLYPGLMIENERPTVLEFNARFGDPETQTYLRLLKSDLLEILLACADGTLAETAIEWSTESAVTVVAASDGYPGAYEKGTVISGLDEAARLPGIVVFHAGTAQKDGQTVTSGGRVLGVSATGKDLADAQYRAYEAMKLIRFEGMQFRHDIGNKALPIP